jgi:succinate dehydrogenase / fumarate reductase, iron-sulfur subunit
MRGKVTPMGALKPHKIPKQDLKAVQAIFDKIESRPERYELNLYIVGEDEAPQPVAASPEGSNS